MYALQSGNMKKVKLCLDAGLNPFCEDFLGKSTVDYAKNYTTVNVVGLDKSVLEAQAQWRMHLNPQ